MGLSRLEECISLAEALLGELTACVGSAPSREGNDRAETLQRLASALGDLRVTARSCTGDLEASLRKRTEQLEQAQAELVQAGRLKNEFLANMSHELRNPLHVILGMSEALQDQVYGPLNEKQLKSLKTIEQSGRLLLAIINDILDLSKIEAGKFQVELGRVSIKGVCESSLRFVKQIAAKKRITVHFNLDPAVSEIDADERVLKQILVNLLGNAVKFTGEGGSVGLDVTGDAQGNRVLFTIWDSGIGISQEKLHAIFTPLCAVERGSEPPIPGDGARPLAGAAPRGAAGRGSVR